MARRICEHCNEPIKEEDTSVIHNGICYHQDCMKCFVCNETDLHDSETFRGVIFCASCCQRIWRGCTSVRNGRISSRCSKDGVRERSCGSASDVAKTIKILKIYRSSGRCDRTKPDTKEYSNREKNLKDEYSDWRIAEIGASTEIAQTTLRKVYNNSAVVLTETTEVNYHGNSTPNSTVHFKSSSNTSGPEISISSAANFSGDADYGLNYCPQCAQLERQRTNNIKRYLTLPVKYFKENVWKKSSLISFSNDRCDGHRSPAITPKEKMKTLFFDDVLDHRARGIRNLYPTINKEKRKYRVGWLSLPRNRMFRQSIFMTRLEQRRGCKHYKRSHSYRCMRRQVMYCAGPTKEELARTRARISNALVVPKLMKRILKNLLYNHYHKDVAVTAPIKLVKSI